MDLIRFLRIPVNPIVRPISVQLVRRVISGEHFSLAPLCRRASTPYVYLTRCNACGGIKKLSQTSDRITVGFFHELDTRVRRHKVIKRYRDRERDCICFISYTFTRVETLRVQSRMQIREIAPITMTISSRLKDRRD